MCGLTGILSQESKLENFQKLVAMTQDSLHRGRDSSGFAWFNHGNKRVMFVKSQREPEDLAEVLQDKPVIDCGIGHVRAMTLGSPTINDNNHPVVYKHYVLVHNGHVSNSWQLAKDFPEMDMPGQVDSRWLVWLIGHFVETKKMSVVEAIQETAKHCIGSYAILLMCGSHPGKIFAARHTSPLEISYDEKEKTACFASERAILEAQIMSQRMFGGVLFDGFAETYLYSVPNDTGLVATFKEGELDIETFTIEPKAYSYPGVQSTPAVTYPLLDNGSAIEITDRDDLNPDDVLDDMSGYVVMTAYVKDPNTGVDKPVYIDGFPGKIDYSYIIDRLLMGEETLERYRDITVEIHRLQRAFTGQAQQKILAKLIKRIRRARNMSIKISQVPIITP